MYVCMYARKRSYIHTNICIYTYIHMHMHIYIHKQSETYSISKKLENFHTYTQIYAHTHKYIHTHTNTYIHTYIHTQTDETYHFNQQKSRKFLLTIFARHRHLPCEKFAVELQRERKPGPGNTRKCKPGPELVCC